MTLDNIEDILFSDYKEEIITTALTLQVPEEPAKLLADEINKRYLLFINLDQVVKEKNLFIQLPNGRSLTLKIV